MNIMARKAASGAWSALCMVVAALLVGTFVYWVVIQRPNFDIPAKPVQEHYVATAGSVIYIDNPIKTAQVGGSIVYSNVLVSGDQLQRYVLPSPEEARQESTDAPKIIPDASTPATSLYAVYIPSWVKPGVYSYRVTAHYRLNPIRTGEIDLPPMTIRVE